METFSALLSLCAGNSPVPVNSPHKGQWRGALMFSLIWARINDWVNNREAGDLRRHLGHYDVNVMKFNEAESWTFDIQLTCILVIYFRYSCPVLMLAGETHIDFTVVRVRIWLFTSVNFPDSKLHGANIGSIWGRQDPGGPHVGPMNFAIWVAHHCVWQGIFICLGPSHC